MGGRFKMEGTFVYLWLIHVDVWQKQTQYCKIIILQLKIIKLKKFSLKLKKERITTRPYRCDLNQVDVMNRFKKLDLVDRVLEELWIQVHNIVQEAGTKTILKKRNARMQNGCLRRLYK